VKDPRFCDYVDKMVESGRFAVDHVFIPIRELDQAAASRAMLSREKVRKGGLWKTAQPHAQRAVLAETFYKLMVQLARHEIPFTLMSFPRFVEDSRYAYEKLSFLVSQIPFDEFDALFNRVSNPALVHNFEPRQVERALAAPSLSTRLASACARLFRHVR